MVTFRLYTVHVFCSIMCLPFRNSGRFGLTEREYWPKRMYLYWKNTSWSINIHNYDDGDNWGEGDDRDNLDNRDNRHDRNNRPDNRDNVSGQLGQLGQSEQQGQPGQRIGTTGTTGTIGTTRTTGTTYQDNWGNWDTRDIGDNWNDRNNRDNWDDRDIRENRSSALSGQRWWWPRLLKPRSFVLSAAYLCYDLVFVGPWLILLNCALLHS